MGRICWRCRAKASAVSRAGRAADVGHWAAQALRTSYERYLHLRFASCLLQDAGYAEGIAVVQKMEKCRSGAQFSHESMMSHVCYKQVRGSRDHGELMSRGSLASGSTTSSAIFSVMESLDGLRKQVGRQVVGSIVIPRLVLPAVGQLEAARSRVSIARRTAFAQVFSLAPGSRQVGKGKAAPQIELDVLQARVDSTCRTAQKKGMVRLSWLPAGQCLGNVRAFLRYRPEPTEPQVLVVQVASCPVETRYDTFIQVLGLNALGDRRVCVGGLSRGLTSEPLASLVQ
ncbi:hypothetical protein AK812_SmicGene15018 [Symbiodinium microadriaticum]|uniref:Uncharacterized protein n=1 Tax=Symbiodinium microadriaticum TaxID=2951 RepID=A0A1Q9E418_SYMMI|nr:hypothetical protein AK812_SmicGene15018 [Symbiodinium microadriaticum]